MSFITRSKLLKYQNLVQNSVSLRKSVESQKIKTAATQVTVFLSHSHLDSDLVESVRAFLSSMDVNAFVDWKDSSMPSSTNVETAKIIKRRIDSFEKFIMISSLNSKNSAWVPWELEYADSSKGLNNIAIFPVSDDHEEWKGSEYMGLYSKIETADSGEYGVFAPGSTTGSSLKNWLLEKKTILWSSK